MDEVTVKTIPEALIPSTFDELPLTLFEFRLAAHIMRRCGKEGVCFESDGNMARYLKEKCDTKTARETVNRARKFLVAIGLFDTYAEPGQSVKYTRRPHSQWASMEEIKNLRYKIKNLRYIGMSASHHGVKIADNVILESQANDGDITADVIEESHGSDQSVTGDVIEGSQGSDKEITGDVIEESHKGVPIKATPKMNAEEGSVVVASVNVDILSSDALMGIYVQAGQDPRAMERFKKASALSFKKDITIEQVNLYHLINVCSAIRNNVQYAGIEFDLSEGLPEMFGKDFKGSPPKYRSSSSFKHDYGCYRGEYREGHRYGGCRLEN